LTDGCFGVTGAHEIYLSKKARELAPIRLTGNYGSEVLRGVSTLKPVDLSPNLFGPRFTEDPWTERINGSTNPITFAAFTEVPSSLFGSLAAGRSQIRFRTPYLDNEIVALAYQAPEYLRRSPLPAWDLIESNSPSLSKIPTDRGVSREQSGLVTMFRRFYSEVTFKLDYLNNEGWPNWLSPLEPVFRHVTATLGIVGLHKYLHYRSWFRHELAGYLKSAIANARAQPAPFWNASFLENMANDHINGRRNYVLEINAVLTLEAVERLLFRSLPFVREESDSLAISNPGSLAFK
jgi:asparagine synthase (glutamine-hydrolysing)